LQIIRADGSLSFKRDQDLRDTAVTWLARAGATLPEIASITGHSLRSIHQVLQHYLAITPELSDSAIAKLVAWMKKEGMVI
jgi:integrase